MKYLVLLCLLMSCNFYEQKVCKEKVILEVGGCDKYGDCGVIYLDGKKGLESFPVKGEKVCR